MVYEPSNLSASEQASVESPQSRIWSSSYQSITVYWYDIQYKIYLIFSDFVSDIFNSYSIDWILKTIKIFLITSLRYVPYTEVSKKMALANCKENRGLLFIVVASFPWIFYQRNEKFLYI